MPVFMSGYKLREGTKGKCEGASQPEFKTKLYRSLDV